MEPRTLSQYVDQFDNRDAAAELAEHVIADRQKLREITDSLGVELDSANTIDATTEWIRRQVDGDGVQVTFSFDKLTLVSSANGDSDRFVQATTKAHIGDHQEHNVSEGNSPINAAIASVWGRFQRELDGLNPGEFDVHSSSREGKTTIVVTMTTSEGNTLVAHAEVRNHLQVDGMRKVLSDCINYYLNS